MAHMFPAVYSKKLYIMVGTYHAIDKKSLGQASQSQRRTGIG